MLHSAVRTLLSTYLAEGRIPALSEIGLAESEYARTKDAAFVTLYRDGKVVASSGRPQPKLESTAKEAVENALLCLKDPRLSGLVASVDDLKHIRIRVDVLPVANRRVVANASAIDPQKEGVMFLMQAKNKLSVVLPGMAALATSGSDLLGIAVKKAGLDAASLKEGDYVAYAIRTEVSSDF